MNTTAAVPAAELAAPRFVILWADGQLSLCDGRRVSEMYDMGDCDGMEGVKSIFSVDQDVNLVPVAVGKPRKINTHEENPFYYESAPIMAGTRQVGTVTHTDH